MYCPDGYETIATAYRRCQQAAYEWSRLQPAIEKPHYPGLIIDTGMDEEYRRGGYREWLWSRFARHTFNQLYCVSASGVVLRLDVESGSFFMNLPLDFPDDIEAQKGLDDLNGDIFFWIDNRAFAIRGMHEGIVDEFSDPQGYQRAVMEPLRGRPVLWKPPHADMNSDAFVQLILTPRRDEVAMPPPPRRMGRPAIGKNLELRDIVLSVFTELYPTPPATKKEAVWNEAQAWIKRHSGQDVGRTTIQTWLAPIWDNPAGK